jgi:type 1 glutamine amidotransferase
LFDEMQFFKYISVCLAVTSFAAAVGCSAAPDNDTEAVVETPKDKQISVLIVDGQNNHAAWPQTTAMMKSFLETAGKFSVEVCRTRYTWNGGELLQRFPLEDGKKYEDLPQPKADPDFSPDFSSYDVVICNFGHNAASWPQKTQDAFVEFVKNGGGLVVVHAADNSFPSWREYNEMIGLGGWGGRNENAGPYVYFSELGEEVRDTSKGGGGGHGPQHKFAIVIRKEDHPITKGLPVEFLHTKDELYERLRGPAENMTILATAFADPQQQGSGRHEPMMMTVNFGDGRIFHTTLGHADYSCQCVGFITWLLRGTEWAATGDVTIGVPDDYPTADRSSSREFNPPANKVALEPTE